MARAEGRDAQQLEIITTVEVSTRDELQRWEALGVKHLVECPWRRGSEAVTVLQRFAEDVLNQA